MMTKVQMDTVGVPRRNVTKQYVVAVCIALFAAAATASLFFALPALAADRVGPRIVKAAMKDADTDGKTDRVILTYSERVLHPLDTDGRYPFAVSTYGITKVASTRSTSLVIFLREKAAADGNAKPSVKYARTASQPVRDAAGNQAVGQTFAETFPVLAIFVAPVGDDAAAGTETAPMLTVNRGVAASAAKGGRDVYVRAGTYAEFTGVEVASRIAIRGGYAPGWRRGSGLTVITGSPQAVLAANDTGVLLEQLTLRATQAGTSAYGIRAIDGSSLTLQRVTVTTGDGAVGRAGFDGTTQPGSNGSPGEIGDAGNCDGDSFSGSPVGGDGGESPAFRTGGQGGHGGEDGDSGGAGREGLFGTPGGAGGAGGDNSRGRDGGDGWAGAPGAPGSRGGGGTNTTERASNLWFGVSGGFGSIGLPGNGGGGGGGGGGQSGPFLIDGDGNAGGGGGGGALGGNPGDGGSYGGGSFGVYLFDSTLVATSSSITAGSGGQGGRGGDGGLGGIGGAGGTGENECSAEAGIGGDGGRGGNGGQGGAGGGGAGGPSVGVMKVGSSTATLTSTAVLFSTGGPGGAPGIGGAPASPAQAGVAQAILLAP